MCPLCVATVGLMVSGAAAFVRKVRARSEQERLDVDRRERAALDSLDGLDTQEAAAAG